MKNYIIIQCDTSDSFCKQVNEHLSNGYVCHGYVFTTGSGFRYNQAMYIPIELN